MEEQYIVKAEYTGNLKYLSYVHGYHRPDNYLRNVIVPHGAMTFQTIYCSPLQSLLLLLI